MNFFPERVEAKPAVLIVLVLSVVESSAAPKRKIGKGVRSDSRLGDVSIRSVLPQGVIATVDFMDLRVPVGKQSTTALVSQSIGH